MNKVFEWIRNRFFPKKKINLTQDVEPDYYIVHVLNGTTYYRCNICTGAKRWKQYKLERNMHKHMKTVHGITYTDKPLPNAWEIWSTN